MKVSESIRKAIDDRCQGEVEAAMLHSCKCVDGTARQVYPTLANKARFTRLIRESYGTSARWSRPGLTLQLHDFRSRYIAPRPTAGSRTSRT